MQRRKFMQFCGAAMVGTSLAIFGTGLVNSPVVHALPGLNPEKDNHIRYEGPVMENQWIGGETDTYESWAKVWAAMGPKFVDNVFAQSPLFTYLQKKDKMVLCPSRLADHAGVDVSDFGPKEG